VELLKQKWNYGLKTALKIIQILYTVTTLELL
jgi:hypothetical protein